MFDKILAGRGDWIIPSLEVVERVVLLARSSGIVCNGVYQLTPDLLRAIDSQFHRKWVRRAPFFYDDTLVARTQHFRSCTMLCSCEVFDDLGLYFFSSLRIEGEYRFFSSYFHFGNWRLSVSRIGVSIEGVILWRVSGKANINENWAFIGVSHKPQSCLRNFIQKS